MTIKKIFLLSIFILKLNPINALFSIHEFLDLAYKPLNSLKGCPSYVAYYWMAFKNRILPLNKDTLRGITDELNNSMTTFKDELKKDLDAFSIEQEEQRALLTTIAARIRRSREKTEKKINNLTGFTQKQRQDLENIEICIEGSKAHHLVQRFGLSHQRQEACQISSALEKTNATLEQLKETTRRQQTTINAMQEALISFESQKRELILRQSAAAGNAIAIGILASLNFHLHSPLLHNTVALDNKLLIQGF